QLALLEGLVDLLAQAIPLLAGLPVSFQQREVVEGAPALVPDHAGIGEAVRVGVNEQRQAVRVVVLFDLLVARRVFDLGLGRWPRTVPGVSLVTSKSFSAVSRTKAKTMPPATSTAPSRHAGMTHGERSFLALTFLRGRGTTSDSSRASGSRSGCVRGAGACF